MLSTFQTLGRSSPMRLPSHQEQTSHLFVIPSPEFQTPDVSFPHSELNICNDCCNKKIARHCWISLTSVCDLACKRLPLFTTFSVIIILCDASKSVVFSRDCLKKSTMFPSLLKHLFKKVHNLVAQLMPTIIAGETTMLRLVDLSLRINTDLN